MIWLLPLLASVTALLSLTIHTVQEGHVGVYWQGGALLNQTSGPGFHLKIPLITQFEAVQVTIQTDEVRNIPCGTSGGVLITFDKVEVVNRLKKEYVLETIMNYTTKYDTTMIFNKIHHEINQFCSSHTLQEVYITAFDTIDEYLMSALQKDCNIWAPGIEIVQIRVTKPSIPKSIMLNFEQIESKKTAYQIAVQSQKVLEKEAETKMKQDTIQAEAARDVALIQLQQQVAAKEGTQKMERIQNEIHLEKEKALADAEFYKKERDATANIALHTPAYIQLEATRALAQNHKIYWGEKLPSFLIEERGATHEEKVIAPLLKQTGRFG